MASDEEKIFSREALDKLRSPEKLNTLIPITNSVSWMALASILFLIFAIILWSIFGAFTVKAEGMGLIMDSAGVVNITSIASGKITNLYIKEGDHIKNGDLIAHIEQPEQVADTQISQYGVWLASSERDVINQVYQHNAKQNRQSSTENVYSDYTGIVDEITVNSGTVIGAGQPICSVRLTQNRSELLGVFYVPVDMGKRVEPGMTIQLAPNGLDVSKTGSLIGVVRSVSQYPVTSENIIKTLGNAALAQWFIQNKGALIEIQFDLVKDETSPTGYLWTSQIGKQKPITAGSFCTGFIIVEREAPIERVFYKVTQFLRNR